MTGTLVHEFLRQAHVPYTIVPHRPAFTAQEDAAATHIRGRDWAKVVVCFVDGIPIQAVVPAPTVVDLERLLALARGSTIRLAAEHELRELFPDCEPGAMPPFGPVYRQRVYVDLALAGEDDIAFDGGTHSQAICMRWPDFAAAVQPIVGRFAERPLDGVGGFDVG